MHTPRANLPGPQGNILAGGFICVHPNGQGQGGRAEERELERLELRVEMPSEIIRGAPRRVPCAGAHTPILTLFFPGQGLIHTTSLAELVKEPNTTAFTKNHAAS